MLSYAALPDRLLFDLMRLEDETAFKAIYDRYFDALYVHAYKRLKDSEESRDVIQEIFTVLWDKRGQIVPRGNLSGYLYTAVRNRIFNIIAHKQVASTHLQSLQAFINRGECQTDHLVREKELRAIIDEEIAALPDKMQEIFELSRTKYLSHKEIASELNLSEHTVKKQINNALRILRAKLGILLFLVLPIQYMLTVAIF
ncbi:RNA polymerase sigma-70 factor [Parapedobacter lycopersici]|uniref:RNA polymerase sigma-70 factor n=1 Tax=Parapedobacter lycopersici TaxID=1864939 RepID=UPI00214D29DB|nr:RNA polymerase sigma-70 factor [Parapedobacter lycopersici]